MAAPAPSTGGAGPGRGPTPAGGDPAEGEKAIEWYLLTTRAVHTLSEAFLVVNYLLYAALAGGRPGPRAEKRRSWGTVAPAEGFDSSPRADPVPSEGLAPPARGVRRSDGRRGPVYRCGGTPVPGLGPGLPTNRADGLGLGPADGSDEGRL